MKAQIALTGIRSKVGKTQENTIAINTKRPKYNIQYIQWVKYVLNT